MKKQTLWLLSIALIILKAGNVYSQCIPDTVTCKDTLLPGQICPEVLPAGFLDVPYNQTVTILPPSSFLLFDVPITIVKIRIDTITNLPPGIVYQSNAIELYPDTAYCVLLSGIPTQAGEFEIAITVIPYIDLFGNGSIIESSPVVNDTSVKIFVYEEVTDIKDMQPDEFDVVGNLPNPFSETTEIGFKADNYSLFKLSIYNYLGILIYSETIDAGPGRNLFRFNGENLSPGYYLYTISNKQTVYSDRLIKTR